VDSTGLPIKGAEVQISGSGFKNYLTEDRNGDSSNAQTGESGEYNIHLNDTGSYTIEINDRLANASMRRFYISEGDSMVDIGMDTLRPYGSISGNVVYPYFVMSGFSVQINGLKRSIPIDLYGNFHVSDVPEGTYLLRVVNSAFQPVDTTFDSITVVHGTNVTLTNQDWIRLRVQSLKGFSDFTHE
jgi:hypothetical protein